MAKQKAQVTLAIQFNELTFDVTSNEVAMAIVKKLNRSFNTIAVKALGLPRGTKLPDAAFSGSIIGKIVGHDASFVFSEFGSADVEDENDDDNSEDGGSEDTDDATAPSESEDSEPSSSEEGPRKFRPRSKE